MIFNCVFYTAMSFYMMGVLLGGLEGLLVLLDGHTRSDLWAGARVD